MSLGIKLLQFSYTVTSLLQFLVVFFVWSIAIILPSAAFCIQVREDWALSARQLSVQGSAFTICHWGLCGKSSAVFIISQFKLVIILCTSKLFLMFHLTFSVTGIFTLFSRGSWTETWYLLWTNSAHVKTVFHYWSVSMKIYFLCTQTY